MLDNKLEALNRVPSSTEATIQFRYYIIILTLFSSTWLISNISAVKLVSIFGITLTGGFIVFPFTTVLSSIIVEVYGYKSARQAIWSGFILNISFVLLINIVNFLPSSAQWNLNSQFNNVLVPQTRIIFASLTSFLLSDFINSYLMAKMKIKNQGRSLLKRILISCGISMSLDITCFMLLAFYGAMSNILLLNLLIAAYLKKCFCQLLLTPLIWYLIELLKNAEGLEVYDYDTKFNPFSIDNVYKFNSSKKCDIKKAELNIASDFNTNL